MTLAGCTYGNGRTLQQAGDDLLGRLVRLALGLRLGIGGLSSAGPAGADTAAVEFLHEVGEIAASGGDVRARVFG